LGLRLGGWWSVSVGPCQTRQSRTKTPDQCQKRDACPVTAFSLPPDEIHCMFPPGITQKKATNILPIFGWALGVRGQLIDQPMNKPANFYVIKELLPPGPGQITLS